MTGQEIRGLRRKLDWTQERFAIEVGISVRTVARWEQGKALPSPLALDKIRQIAERHGIWVIGRIGEGFTTAGKPPV